MNTLEFDEFVRVRSGRLLRLAYALTQNHQLAEDLLQTAYSRTWPRWKRIEGDPEPYVRTVLVNTHNSWWRRRWNNERPAETLPEHAGAPPQSEVDSRDEVWRALSRLPKQQRAVLVLRYFEDLTEAQIAETLSISPGAVKGYAAKGLMKLRADETLRLPELPEQPAGTERIAAIHDRVKTRRRQRLVTIAAACAVLIALIAGYAAAPWHNRALNEPLGDFVPEYVNGYRMVVRMSGDKGDLGRATATYTLADLRYGVYIHCAYPGGPIADDIRVEVRANGEIFTGINCVHSGVFPSGSYPIDQLLQAPRILLAGFTHTPKAGSPVKFELSLHARKRDGGSGEVPPGTVFGFGLAEPVAYGNYPLPSAPPTLEALGSVDQLNLKNPQVLDKSRLQVQLVPGRKYAIRARANTPGVLGLTINDQMKGQFSWWNYKAGERLLTFVAPAGNPTLTLRPEQLTGDWYLVVSEQTDHSGWCDPGVEAMCDRLVARGLGGD